MNAICSFRLCTLNTAALLEKIDSMTDCLFQTGQIPSRHIPARPNEDYDLLIGELLLRFQEHEKFINQIEEKLSELSEDNKSLLNLKREVSAYLAKPFLK